MQDKKKINKVHIDRFSKLINYIKKCESKEILLKRKEVADIVGVSEGDSLKMTFKILTEYPELYSEHFLFKKEGRNNIFTKVEQKKEIEIEVEKEKPKSKPEIDKRIKKVLVAINETVNLLKETQTISEDDCNFCLEYFKDTLTKIKLFVKEYEKAPDSQKYNHSLYVQIQDMNDMLTIYNIIA